jgi:hypothetical protein
MRHPCRVVGSIGRHGAVRSSAWICDCSSTHRGSAFSGGAIYRPTTSETLLMNRGSVASFQVCTTYGLRPNVREIRGPRTATRPLTWSSTGWTNACRH